MKSSRTAVLLVGGVLALGLGACGGGSSSEGSTEDSTTPATTQATSKEPTSSGGLTAPGTKLKFGEAATLVWVPPSEFDVEGAGEKVKVTVDSIEKGSIDDFSEVELEEDEKNSTPYYMNVTIEALEEIPDSLTDEPDLTVTAIDDRGQEQLSVTFLGEFSRCNDSERPKPFKSGESYESCFAYLMPGGGSIVEAQWTSGTAAPGEVTPYFEEPVVWSGS